MNRSGKISGTTSRSEPVDHASARRGFGPSSLGWLLIALVSFAAFGLVTWLVASKTGFWFDKPLLDLAHGWTGLTGFWNLVSDAANFPMIGIGVGIVVWLLWKHRRREAVLVVVLLAAATLGSEGVKELVARPRPITAAEIGVVYSYPSGHVLEAATIFGIIALLMWRSALPMPVRIGIPVLFIFLVVLVGVARLALAEHYPSDILGGALAGTGTLATFALLTSQHPVSSKDAETPELDLPEP